MEWVPIGADERQPKYEGETINEEPNGIGTLIYPGGHKYEGNWKDGEQYGRGIFTWSDGRKYTGIFRDGKPYGQGTYTNLDGTKNLGKWEVNEDNFSWNQYIDNIPLIDKKITGVLSYRKENARWGWFEYGDEGKDGKYVGEIVNMKPNGSGIFVYGKGKWEGDKYDGQWKDGKFHGQGTFTRTNGQKFTGEWKHNVFWNVIGYDKFGRIIKKYRRGVQLIIRKEDEEQKRTVEQKRKIGVLFREVPLSKWERGGKKWMTEGDRKIHGIYEGEILNGVPDGEGIYTWYNVEKYVGEFRKGLFHGHGRITYLSGITADGVFIKNKEWDTLRTESNGGVTGKFIKGRYYPLKP